MDKIIERALEHWYAPEHELYGDPLPALMGIVGESGELCDLWKKKLYKPGYEFSRDEFIDELGDVLFYAAVLCHYNKLRPTEIAQYTAIVGSDMLRDITTLNYIAGWLMLEFINGKTIPPWRMGRIIGFVNSIAWRMEIEIDQLSQLNYTKLNERAANGEGYNRGNERLYICNRADDCDVKCGHKTKHSYDSVDQEECGEIGCYASGLSDATCVQCSE